MSESVLERVARAILAIETDGEMKPRYIDEIALRAARAAAEALLEPDEGVVEAMAMMCGTQGLSNWPRSMRIELAEAILAAQKNAILGD